MKTEERTYKVYISCDGKEFKSLKACEQWEIENVAGVRQSRIRKLLEELQRMKRSGGWYTLRQTSSKLNWAREKLLEAAKSKRRNTLQFAVNMSKACDNYMSARHLHEVRLQKYRHILAELKEIEPRFDRSKKGLAK